MPTRKRKTKKGGSILSRMYVPSNSGATEQGGFYAGAKPVWSVGKGRTRRGKGFFGDVWRVVKNTANTVADVGKTVYNEAKPIYDVVKPIHDFVKDNHLISRIAPLVGQPEIGATAGTLGYGRKRRARRGRGGAVRGGSLRAVGASVF